MSREKLLKIVVGGFAILGIAFFLVLVSSLGNRQTSAPSDPFADLSIGATTKRWFQGQRVWATRLNQAQNSQLGAGHRCEGRAVCALKAASSMAGVDVVYSRAKPPQLGAEQGWLGGFVDPASNAVFDLSGRPIQTSAKLNDVKALELIND